MSEPIFGGFTPPSANFTPTPNQFFDVVVGHYDPCIVTVVAVLIRETLGWQNKHTGARKIEAALAQSDFVGHGLSINSVRKGLRAAIEAGFIIQTAQHSTHDPARYALRWSDEKEQAEAIEQERRGFGAQKTKAGGVAIPGERKRKAKTRHMRIRGSSVGGPINGGPTITPPDYATHLDSTLKETESGKEIEKTPKNVNVPKEGLSTLSPHKAMALLEIVRLTNDAGSRDGFAQLYDIAHNAKCGDSWEQAVGITEHRIKKSTQPLERPGAYFRKTITALLNAEGVYVPTGTAAERDEVKAALRASLGIDEGQVQ